MQVNNEAAQRKTDYVRNRSRGAITTNALAAKH